MDVAQHSVMPSSESLSSRSTGPTPDISSMVIFASPMLAVYVFSIGIAWFVHPTQRRAREAKRSKA